MVRAETASSTRAWAEEEFGTANLGDKRRNKRLISMAERAALAPSGKVSEVFDEAAERQGAYDFLESPHVDVRDMLAAMGRAVAQRSAEDPFVFVPVDGTSLNLVDRACSKDFGPIGTQKQKSRGLKVISALGVSAEGVPLGVAAMTYWVRPDEQGIARTRTKRTLEEKELRYWNETIDQAIEHLGVESGPRLLWFQLDREADAWPILEHLASTGHTYTVRGSWNRRVRETGDQRRYILDVLASRKPMGTYTLHVSAGPGRTARTARTSIRTASVTLDVRDKLTSKRHPLHTNVVWVREESRVPEGEERVEWLLLTNHPIETLEDACLVVFGYTQRWRIEEFHRTWKQGGCNVEATQLQSSEHVKRWATLLAAVAMRIERLKYLSRNQPDLPATEELSRYEIDALILKRRKRKNPGIPEGILTIGIATQWIAELGGYTGKSSGGPPGSVTIGRGLERLAPAAETLQQLDEAGLLR